MEASNSTSTPRSHSPTPEEQNMPDRGKGYWATIMDNSINTAEPISPAIPWVVKDTDCPLRCDKSSTSTTCTFAPAQSPQPSRRSGKMVPIETSMPANNRKRPHADMDSADSDPEDNAKGRDIRWTIEHLRKPVASGQLRNLWDKAQRYQSPFRVKGQRKDALDLKYIVEPPTWLEMQNIGYTIGGVSYGKNDYVYVRPPDLELLGDDDDMRFWVAYILEIRATNTSRAYALVVWMYRPDELPRARMGTEAPTSGRRWYHGKHELVASNHLDIVDVNSMAGHATVAQWFEDDDDNTHHGFYWRQTFNIISRSLSSIRKYCICDDYYNPDLILLACPNKNCRLWMHEECIAKNSKATTYNDLPARSEDIIRRKGQPTWRPHDHFTRKKSGSNVGTTDSTKKTPMTENLYCLKCSTALG
ncbi:hypothetical protein V491_00906 [Pseudogymnoascus sp. VKM F-3775]|nr:hypothetical protein V491_00906 [Pseudogymnoascus sp. VKM F-3775]